MNVEQYLDNMSDELSLNVENLSLVLEAIECVDGIKGKDREVVDILKLLESLSADISGTELEELK